MKKNDLKKYKLPDSPGVYFFLKGKSILYIGKATSLKGRVTSYFSPEIISTRGSRIVDMVTESNDVRFEKTDSVLEALMLESVLIKKHKPFYNAKEKDDKSYYQIIITNEIIPRILIIRQKDLEINKNLPKIKEIFGPFPHGNQLKEALKIIRKIFPFFDTNFEIDLNSDKQKRLLQTKMQIGLYPNIFDGEITISEYKKNISNIIKIFKGKKKDLLLSLNKEMNKLAKEEKFEKANKIKKTIFALQHINDISLIKNNEEDDSKFSLDIEAYDIAHIQGQNMVGVMTVVRDGIPLKSKYKKFIIKDENAKGDTQALKHILERRLKHFEWGIPKIIVVDGGKAQYNVASKLLKKTEIGKSTILVAVTKDEKHRPKSFIGPENIIKKYSKDILIANNEAHRFAVNFYRSKHRKSLK